MTINVLAICGSLRAKSTNRGLVRYAQAQVESQVVDGQRRYKSIMLLNGFAQNTLPFVAEELGPRSLAAMLYAQGQSHKDIAATLGLTPATVRTYLRTAYAALGVRNKLELVAALRNA